MSQLSDVYGCPSTGGAGRLSSSPTAAAGLSKGAAADKYGSQRYSSICDSGLGSIQSGTESLRQSVADEELQSHLSNVSIKESLEGGAAEAAGMQPHRAAFAPASYRAPSADYFRQDVDGDTLLHIAIIFRNADLAHRIIASGPTPQQINLRNDLRQTALHLAVSTKQPLVVRGLLAAGAELQARDWFGNTAVHLACRDGELECLRELVSAASAAPSLHPSSWQQQQQQQRLPFDVCNYEGLAPLHLAANGGHYKLVSCLVESRLADINFQEAKAGRTLLYLAAERDDRELLRLALQLGAEPGVCSYNGARAAAVARARRQSSICDMLKEFEEGQLADASSSSSGADDNSVDEEEMEYSEQDYDDIQINGLPVAVNSL